MSNITVPNRTIELVLNELQNHARQARDAAERASYEATKIATAIESGQGMLSASAQTFSEVLTSQAVYQASIHAARTVVHSTATDVDRGVRDSWIQAAATADTATRVWFTYQD